MNFKNTILITHAGCMDGTTCGLLFVAAGGNRRDILYSSPQNEAVDATLKNLINGDVEILLVDVAPTLQLVKEIKDKNFNNVTLLDHHASSIPLNDFDFCDIEVKNGRCGSKMFFDWLIRLGAHHGESAKLLKYKELVNLVDDIDRWVNLYPESKTLATLHDNLGQELFFERFLKNPSADLTAQEQYLIDVANKKREINIARRKQQARIVTKEFDGHPLRIAFVVVFGDDPSTLGSALCSDPALDVDVAVIVRGESISLRASSDCPVDISKIAAKFGGGGHAASSGCDIHGVLGKDLVDLVIENMRLQ